MLLIPCLPSFQDLVRYDEKTEVKRMYDLKHYIDDDDEEGVGEVVEEPDLHGLDDGSAGKGAGDGEVDGGQDHHAGDVDGDDQVELVVRSKENLM